MVDSFSSMLLWSNVIGFGLSILLNIVYNLIQKKEARHKISFGTIILTGIFFSIVAGAYFILQGLNL